MEEWKNIDERYSVSNYGRVYSNLGNGSFLGGNTGGYKTVSLPVKKGVYKQHKVHRLVALHFIDNPEDKQFINHIDGIKDNNHVDNLEWCTAEENSTHAWSNGLMSEKLNGVEHCNSKYSEDQILNVVSLHKKCLNMKEVSRQTGVEYQTVRSVLKGVNWKYLTELV